MKDTIFATHPVDPEVKRKANAAGYRLIDARFAPEGERIMDGQTGQPVEKAADKAGESHTAADGDGAGDDKPDTDTTKATAKGGKAKAE